MDGRDGGLAFRSPLLGIGVVLICHLLVKLFAHAFGEFLARPQQLACVCRPGSLGGFFLPRLLPPPLRPGLACYRPGRINPKAHQRAMGDRRRALEKQVPKTLGLEDSDCSALGSEVHGAGYPQKVNREVG